MLFDGLFDLNSASNSPGMDTLQKYMSCTKESFPLFNNHNREFFIALFQHPLLTVLYRKFLKIDRTLVQLKKQ